VKRSESGWDSKTKGAGRDRGGGVKELGASGSLQESVYATREVKKDQSSKKARKKR